MVPQQDIHNLELGHPFPERARIKLACPDSGLHLCGTAQWVRLLAILLVAGFLWTTSFLRAQADDEATFVEGKIAEFLAEINTGNQAELRSFIKSNYSKSYRGTFNLNVKYLVRQFISLHDEAGELELLSVGRDTFNSRSIAWLRSLETSNFYGLTYNIRQGPDPIRRMGILRGALPSELIISAIPNPLEKRELDDLLERLAADGRFSGTLLLAEGNGSPIYLHSAGIASEDGKPVNNETPYLIASTTKMFTATGIGMLMDQGRLSLDDTLAAYIPEYPAHIADKVTLRNLLTHTSGIELDEIKAFNKRMLSTESLEDILALHLKYLPEMKNYDNFAPLDQFNYSNEGFDLLGLVIQRVTGRDYFEFVQRNIFVTAGMLGTGYNIAENRASIATPFLQGSKSVPDRELPLWGRPAGSFYSTVGDLLRFHMALRSGQLLEPATYKMFTSVQIIGYEDQLYSDKYGLDSRSAI